jgi:hypothetical protein
MRHVPKRRKPGTQPSVQPFEPCGMCSGGWLRDASGAAFRCSCWLIYVANEGDRFRERQRQAAERSK